MSLFNRDSHRRCDNCYGYGKVLDYSQSTDGKEETCDDCLGTGTELTEVGKELAAFLKDHYGLELRKR